MSAFGLVGLADACYNRASLCVRSHGFQQVEVLRTLFWICRFARNCSGTLSRVAAQSAQLRMSMWVATAPFCSVVLAGAKLELELAAAVRSKLCNWNWLLSFGGCWNWLRPSCLPLFARRLSPQRTYYIICALSHGTFT